MKVSGRLGKVVDALVRELVSDNAAEDGRVGDRTWRRGSDSDCCWEALSREKAIGNRGTEGTL